MKRKWKTGKNGGGRRETEHEQKKITLKMKVSHTGGD